MYAAVPEKRKPKPRGENAIIDMFSRLRTFFNWCLDSGYITAEELRQIADFDFSNRPALAVQRDIFVFQCCVGCRIGDLYRMTWSNVEGDVFDYIAGKTKGDNPKTISVPLVTMAKKILKRYESSGRTTFLPFISEQKYNDAIKEVFRLAGINRVVTVLDPTTRREVLKVFEAI
jgi:integrase